MMTPQSLQEEVAKRAAAARDASRCYTPSDHPVSFIEFRPDAHTRSGFAASQLLQYMLPAAVPS